MKQYFNEYFKELAVLTITWIFVVVAVTLALKLFDLIVF